MDSDQKATDAQLAHRSLHGLRFVSPCFAGTAELSAGCDFCRKLLEERQTETGHHASGVRLLNNRPVGDALWTFDYIASQAALFGSFVLHMDIDGIYGSSTSQCFDDKLYEEGMI